MTTNCGTHKAYLEVEAESHFELGYKLGQEFGEVVRRRAAALPELSSTTQNCHKRYLTASREIFPKYVEELEGYAAGAGIPFDSMWCLFLESEGGEIEKCTTLVTDDGEMLAHNEDWHMDNAEDLYVLRRTLNGVTTLELHYAGTLGGNSVSISSNGCIQAVNSLVGCKVEPNQELLPTNLVARWLCDSSPATIDADIAALEKFQRLGGYHHTLIDAHTDYDCTVEVSSQSIDWQAIPSYPFVHTNHRVLTGKPVCETDEKFLQRFGTKRRYDRAKELASPEMDVHSMKQVLNDAANGNKYSILNERTIGSIIVDVQNKQAHIRLAREEEAGWVTYDFEYDN